jgi:hypothetical protein
VEQFDSCRGAEQVAKRPHPQILSAEGDRCLPLILVNESVVSRGTHLSRAQLARAVGQGQGWERSAA